MYKLQKGGKVCNCGHDQLKIMKDAGWKNYVEPTAEEKAKAAKKAAAEEK